MITEAAFLEARTFPSQTGKLLCSPAVEVCGELSLAFIGGTEVIMEIIALGTVQLGGGLKLMLP